MNKIQSHRSDHNYTFLLLGLLVLVIAIFSALKFNMLWKDLNIWQSMANQFPEYGVMTLGVMLCFITGSMDVSFVALGDFASIMGVMFMLNITKGDPSSPQAGMAVVGGIIVTILVGAICGYINGNLISRLGIPPIIATLSTQQVFRGLSIALTGGNAVTGIPLLYGEIGHTALFGFLPVPLLVFIVIFLISAFLLRFTTYGKKLYMIGSNAKAARFSAIDTTKVINTTFVIDGMFAAIGALLMVSTYNSAKADYGSSYLMRCILILVLAGVLPDGGMGKILNVLIAIITVQVISTGVNLFPELNTYYSNLISATLLLVVLMATTRLLGERKFKKTLRQSSKEAKA
jgi:simple sugar transport system permease protein